MQRLISGLLREVVVYKNRSTGGLFREEVQAHLLMKDNLLHAMSKGAFFGGKSKSGFPNPKTDFGFFGQIQRWIMNP